MVPAGDPSIQEAGVGYFKDNLGYRRDPVSKHTCIQFKEGSGARKAMYGQPNKPKNMELKGAFVVIGLFS